MKKVFIVIPVILFLLAGCNGNGASSNPKTVLSAFLTALSKQDISTAKKYVTSDSEGMMNMMQTGLQNTGMQEGSNPFSPEKITIGDADIDGDEARVAVTEKASGESINFILKKEKGDWKVAMDLNTLGRMAEENMKKKGIPDVDLDSLINSIPKEKLEKGKEMADSLSKALKDISPEQIDKAKKILDSLSKQYQ